MAGSEIVVVLTTFPDEDAAVRAARTLVEERLCACAQIETSRIRSFYRWEGDVQDETEILLRLKSEPARLDALRERLVALHPYTVPQFVVIEATASEEYARWLHEQCEP